MKLYVAGPMTGLPDLNYPEFLRVGTILEDKGYEVLNPARIDESYSAPPFTKDWRWYMRRALAMCVHADGIATLPGWTHSRGASLEVHVGIRLELAVRPWWEW